MWIRRELKERAKAVLSGNYWKAFLISIVIALASGGSSGGGGGSGGSSNYSTNYNPPGLIDLNILPFVILFVMIFIGALLFFVSLRIFLGYPLEVGGRRYFVQSAQYNDNTGCFRFAFNGRNYIGIILTMLLRGVFNFLWYLLFIIPGIVKAYAYSMVPYILADNPNIGYKRAIKLSNEMTYGHKFDMFVLDLSFIGWYLLGMLVLFVGMLFVLPYDYATKAELYLVLRKNALERNMCSYNELQLGGSIC